MQWSPKGPVAPAAHSVDVGPVTLALRGWRPEGKDAAAPAPRVVLLAGTGATADDWDVVAGHLGQSREVLAVDLRGHGDSDWPGEYSLRLMADDVGTLLERLGGPPVDLVGHSLGGLVGCLVAAGCPGRVRRFVLEDVGLPHPRPPAAPTRPAGPLRFDWRVVEQVRPEIDDPDAGWPGVLAAIAAPTLVVAGGPSSFVAAEHVDELVATVANARLVTLDAGHLVHQREPGLFVRHVTDFLDRRRPTSSPTLAHSGIPSTPCPMTPTTSRPDATAARAAERT
ncbi:alpha/beta fold hydrolase [Terracoccus luteus]|uniref:Pimeloyl-ACP methyl ester carboxylesterase n=1 Tax=Terracoccus luteus TaxID=53356 RepID=A0A839Q6H7_9MICO|nr:alpha/beta hydrolase [Terracoccus luteus]MBB2988251.1 pimeloyl-ACP methyl ester carboxylesterase [Terracoccus luteus]MCP2173886.1 pimeloyl-ACP methyl ester carboxylesterase [Terracoccus luteus]